QIVGLRRLAAGLRSATAACLCFFLPLPRPFSLRIRWLAASQSLKLVAVQFAGPCCRPEDQLLGRRHTLGRLLLENDLRNTALARRRVHDPLPFRLRPLLNRERPRRL